MEGKKLSIAVRELVEFVLASGDIVSTFSLSVRAQEGIKVHQMLQKSRGENYNPEVTVSFEVERENIVLEVKGRIDGVFSNPEGVFIEEIKSTKVKLEEIDENFNLIHLAQAKCYAYIYASQHSLEDINVQLTYFNVDSGESKYIIKNYCIEELRLMFEDIISRYIIWAKVIMEWEETRDTSIKDLEFPFSDYRKGQRELAINVYRTIRDEKLLFAEAPTGTGKTAAVLFPAIKAIKEGLVEKVFYLTAKTVTRTVAENTISKMKEEGLRLKTLTLTAKDKICLAPEAECNPEECKFAKGHYDRIAAAIKDIFTLDSFHYENIREYADKHTVCPFEFSLDLSLWSDCIICDYNYVFDPRVYLKRFFLEGDGNYAFLIDEAHNLADRAREMFSAELLKSEVMSVKKLFKSSSKKIYKGLEKLNQYFLKLGKESEEEFYINSEPPKDIMTIIRNVNKSIEEYLAKSEKSPDKKELLELYFKLAAFTRTYEYFDDKFVTYVEKLNKNDIKIKLFCLDPSLLLKEGIKRGRGSILFSATLSPMDYFISLLGGDEETSKLYIKSPFPRDNLSIIVNNKINTTYKRREHSYEEVVKSINSVVSVKLGNYLIFLPSYKYMNEISERFLQLNQDKKVIVQKSGMNEEEKQDFLDNFNQKNDQGLVAFAVMGGSFGEGIDLVGERLSGAVIVGVGLPQLCLERNIIMDYFNKAKGLGFEYSYMYPGMNKVMQAVGRIIRSEKDRGVALLIDERFGRKEYRKLFPMQWKQVSVVSNNEEITNSVGSFWCDLGNK